MHPNYRSVKSKWVFKIKHNGVYQASLVAYECSQVPGINFSKNDSVVFNNINFCTLLLMAIHSRYSAKIVDVETAFLYGDLKEEIYMECPQGMSNKRKYDCINVDKFFYDLVQAARQYYKKAIEIMKNWDLLEALLTHADMLEAILTHATMLRRVRRA